MKKEEEQVACSC